MNLAVAITLACCFASGATQATPNPFGVFDLDFRGATPEEQILSIDGIGFDGVAVKLASPADLVKLEKYLAVKPDLKVYAGYMHLDPVNINFEGRVKAVVDALAPLDAQLWLIIGGDKTNDMAITRMIQRVADIAARQQVPVSLYPHDHTAIESAEEALVYLKRANRQNVSLTVHACHELRHGTMERIDEVIQAVQPYISLVTISGGDKERFNADPSDWSDSIKPLNEGNLDLRPMLQALDDSGYAGPIIVHNFGLQNKPASHHQDSFNAYQAMRSALNKKEPMSNPADQWVATDGAGRRLPTHAEVGDVRPDKLVGVFYYLWVGNHTRKVHDITEIIKKPKGRREWGPKEAFHFWGEPEHGYHHASDPWVIRRDMLMLANAGVDFIYFDTTNAVLYPETVLAVCRMIAQMRKEGLAAPSICYTTYWNSGQAMNGAYDQIYSKNRYPEIWFRWEGKPLILGKADDPKLRPEVKEFFTIKECWVGGGKPQKNKWSWLSLYPQGYGYSESPDVPEQVSVAVAAHPENPQGKSFHDGEQPPVDENHLSEFTGQGLHVQEQWSRAHELDPRIVMVSQWNEWLAQRFFWEEGRHKQRKGLYAGRPIEMGDSFFVDVYNREFNRDMAPMKGGYTDNYYYQLVSNIRKFKGMQKPSPRPEPVSIQIDGKFGDWNTVQTVHTDPLGDTLHRDFEGTDPATRYVNKTGRNDIVESRAVVDGSNICFQVSTRENLSPHTDPNWMLLFVDVDQDHATGWEGYDLVINRKPSSATKTSMEKWTSKGWKTIGEIEMAYAGKQLELRLPIEFDPSTRPDFGFDFKWADHPRNRKDSTAFFLDGDAAPDRRFNYRY